MRTCGPSTATASAGHTRTHARQATHLSGSILKSTDSTAGALRRGHTRGTGRGNMGPDRAAVKSHDRVLFELAIQRALADPEDFGRLAAVALGVAQRGLDRRALPVGPGHAGAVHHLALPLAPRLPPPPPLDPQRRGGPPPRA